MAEAVNCAIYYDPDGYDTSRPKLVGRHAAGEGFLYGFARYAGVKPFYCWTDSQNYLDQFTEFVRRSQPDAEVVWVRRGALTELSEPGCLFIPGPNLGKFAWRRRSVGDNRYSLCGVTHTTATHAIMDGFTDLVRDPVRRWDAVICTSRVVRETAEKVTGDYLEYLSGELGATRLELPQFPIIPLGVDCERYQLEDDLREQWRSRLGIGADDVVVLFLGRLSFFEKAHPLPMYRAVERAAQRSGRKFHLIQAGWFASKKLEELYRNAAETFSPSVRSLFLDGRKPEVRYQIWAAADIFTSLSDNIQETFGLTPIEAMAAGLPVVVSDWNGYRDTVRDQVDGFRIPTLMPQAPLGADLAHRFADGFDGYARYCGNTSQMIAIDTERCAEAFQRLAEDPALRRKMGEAGRKRARETYDWRVVIRQYQSLWQELAELRAAAADEAPAAVTQNPSRQDPFAVFRSYPTDLMTPEHRVSLAEGIKPQDFVDCHKAGMVSFAADVLPNQKESLAILAFLAKQGPRGAGEIIAQAPRARRRAIFRGLVWLYKLGLVRIDRPS